MAIKVFLSHASVDKPLVGEVKAFLEQGGDIECWLDGAEIDFGDNIVARIDAGLGKSDFLLLFLSAASLKSTWVEAEWTTGLWRDVNGDARLVPVLIGDVKAPTILQTKKYCDLRTNRLEGMKALKGSLLKAKRVEVNHPHNGASLPNFTGREAELAELKERLSQPGALVPITGMPGLGKTYLAREFIRRHAADFENVYELDCQGKDLAALTGDLDRQLNLRPQGDPGEVARQMREWLAGKRCLLLLDNVDDEQPGELVPGGWAAVLVTSRDATIPFFAEYPELRPPLFTDEEALALFRKVVGLFQEDKARQLFRELEYLPMAIMVSAGLVRHDVRYTVESLLSKVDIDSLKHGKSNIRLVLSNAIAALSDNEKSLLAAMAVCASGGVRLDFASNVAGLEERASLDALQVLNQRSLVIELDRHLRRYRLHTLVRKAVQLSRDICRRHAESVREKLMIWDENQLQIGEFIEEGLQMESARVEAPELTFQIKFLALERRTEVNCAETGDRVGLQASYGNQAALLKAWGRLEVAMALHQKEEAICEELGDRAALSRCYGNQAVILYLKGQLHEAMDLRKKEEAIGDELGDRAGLSRCYGNQALILRNWGRLDEAMARLKDQEGICEELGDRAGLQASYGNQAVILRSKGQLDDAMGLIRKRETICQELGDRSGLAYCYWNWGLTVRLQKDDATCKQKLEQALAMFTELGMPRERDAVKAELDEAG